MNNKDFEDGRNLWYTYIQLNGYAFEPTDGGIKTLSKETGKKPADLRKKINTFQEG